MNGLETKLFFFLSLLSVETSFFPTRQHTASALSYYFALRFGSRSCHCARLVTLFDEVISALAAINGYDGGDGDGDGDVSLGFNS